MLGEKELVKCYKCGFYHEIKDRFIRETKDTNLDGTKKYLCDTCKE